MPAGDSETAMASTYSTPKLLMHAFAGAAVNAKLFGQVPSLLRIHHLHGDATPCTTTPVAEHGDGAAITGTTAAGCT